MGVLNLTPDSFSDGGLFPDARSALNHAFGLVEDGADLIDIGGESTRPGAVAVTASEEMQRILPAVKALAEAGLAVSVDTSKAEVAAAALEAGAEVINDVTAGSDPQMFPLVARTGAGVILMHMQGDPRTMQVDPQYEDVVGEVTAFLAGRAEAAQASGIDRDKLALDPGIGFGKNLHHNLALLRHLQVLGTLGLPLVLGVSRKNFLGKITGVDNPADRDLASSVTAALAVERGADIFRVHNVASCREAVAVALAIVRESGG
ncbi:MAG TPA: dihydropteroate synthase [Acidimicrobiia bacterium]|nr:dihydropteroate synthase [Acidimicrobiia bacterium]